MPPGITPPYIVQYSATSVPIVQIAVSSDTLTEQQIFDYAQNFIIQQLGTVQGARVPQPYGGKQRQVMVLLDTNKLYARNLSPQEAATAVLNQNPIIPAGPAKIGDTEYDVKLNSSPDAIPGFNFLPVKTVNGVPVYVKDVAHALDGFAVQTNVVRRDGRRAVLMTVLKAEGASTNSVVQRLREAMPAIQAQMPPELKMEFLFDQSVFVQAAVQGVLRGRHRRRADGPDDSALSRVVAQHAHRRRLHPAVDPDVHRRAVGAGPVAQHHDAGRHGPGGRHPRGRRHGGTREHPPLPRPEPAGG